MALQGYGENLLWINGIMLYRFALPMVVNLGKLDFAKAK
jgi:hypothetical protein